MKRVEVVPYDPVWPRVFERVRAHVWPAVADLALGIEHVGSTAVPGLPAKPVVDACIVVASRAVVPACIRRLAGIGYTHRGDLGVPDREAFRAPEGLPRHHLYLGPRDGLGLRNHLGVRDLLRADPEAARRYGELKASLARRFPDDMDGYVAGKTEFLLGILAQAGLTEAELAEVRRVNQPGPPPEARDVRDPRTGVPCTRST